MTGTAGTDWIWLAAGAGAGVIALALLVWALFWDRARGRKRCPRCWYDMQGAVSDAIGTFRCPECGIVIVRECRLCKTRRRWRWVLVSLILLIAGAGGAWPHLRDGGWTNLIPNAVLVRIVPTDEASWRSTSIRQMPGAQGPPPLVRSMLVRSVDGKLTASQCATFWRRMHLDSSNRNRRLLYLRQRWPRDVPVFLALDYHDFIQPRLDAAAIGAAVPNWPYAGASRARAIRVRPILEGAEWQALNFDDRFSYPVGFVLADALPDRTVFEFQWICDGQAIASFITPPVILVDDVADVLVAVKDDAILATLAANVRLEFWPRPDGTPEGSLVFETNPDRLALTVGLTVEVRCNNATVGIGQRLFAVSHGGTAHRYTIGVDAPIAWNVSALRACCANAAAEWTLSVRGDPDVAIYDLGSDSYWAGEFEARFDAVAIKRWCREQLLLDEIEGHRDH